MVTKRTITVLVAVFVILAVAGAVRANGEGNGDPNIDIKPGSFPNSINSRSNGNIPVAILGSATFDVNDVDVSTVLLEGVAPRVKGNNGSGAVEDVNDDGFPDLVFHFDTQEVMAAIGGAATEMTLTGNLLDGTPFSATDSVRILGNSNGASIAATPGLATLSMLMLGGALLLRRKPV